ncbi:type I restriction endonuclease subunit R [Mycoplasmopsis iners]|uniref:type I restriction endonuclease subunit R n=1 Tax=Mycoplasmopsis iners TaxID=76630 RepID=UPI00068BC20C|nr:type I restriction endonuclease subunit R [Mycoplasmopsis iners]
MEQYKKIAETNDSTLVADIDEIKKTLKRESGYQTEQQLENELINTLQRLGYEYLEVKDENGLLNNLRTQLEKLNKTTFSDREWNDVKSQLTGENKTIQEKTRMIQKESRFTLTRDDGSIINVKYVDKDNIHENRLQVINQYEANNGLRKNRYDVTILVNGLPLVHIELKRRGVNIKEAFNQIDRYQSESFWSETGLFEFVQIFVISNGTNTKYYSNSTRNALIEDKSRKTDSNSVKNGTVSIKKNLKSFEFTINWADAKNQKIKDLEYFSLTFFSKHTLLNILFKYCVFDTNDTLLVMRPYQIMAAERIIQKIIISTNQKTWGKREGGGYIWHTTGSGKTLTSFKTAELAQKIKEIDKVVFVVDRRDLDYQTIREYNRFDKNFAVGIKNTKGLEAHFEEDKYTPDKDKVVIVTIQKLTKYIETHKDSRIYDKKVVFIFDECHRSQFGIMHKKITNAFKKYHLFGFTGTPIFLENGKKEDGELKTTSALFGEKLHVYNIVDAIEDENVLPFKIDYVNTIGVKKGIEDKQIQSINREEALLASDRIEKIVSYLLDHYNQKTQNGERYSYNQITNVSQLVKNKNEEEKRLTKLNGFNSIFAVHNVKAAKKYYSELVKQAKEKNQNLKIALIYTWAPNDKSNDEQFLDYDISEEDFSSLKNLNLDDRSFLEKAIQDYNKMFDTSYDLDNDGFQNYYKDISLRMKNREIDLLIVVNMFLTGFDSVTLNTLWLDKPLRQHSLIQAMSRTNRIFNAVKKFGNIVTFYDIKKEVDEAIALFGKERAEQIVLLKSYKDYINGYQDDQNGEIIPGYKELTEELKTKFPIEDSQKFDYELSTDLGKKQFVTLFGKILKKRNILKTFDEFIKDSKNFLSDRDFQDYTTYYLETRDKIIRRANPDKESILDDLVFEIDLVKQDEINVEYILNIIAQHFYNKKDSESIRRQLSNQIKSSPTLRDKLSLIEEFINKINVMNLDGLDENAIHAKVNEEWIQHVRSEYEKELVKVIKDLNLKEEETRSYMKKSFDTDKLKYQGRALGKTIKSSFLSSNKRLKRAQAYDALKVIFDKYHEIINLNFDEISNTTHKN